MLFAALGRFAYRRRKLVIALWVAVFVPSLVGASGLAAQLKGGGFSRSDSPSQQTTRLMRERLATGISRVTVVFDGGDLDARGAEFKRREREALSALTPQSVPGLVAVETLESTGASDLVSSDSHASLALLEFGVPSEDAQAQIPRIRSLVRPNGLQVFVTGEPAVFEDLERVSSSDLRVAESYALPVAALVLVFVFGSLVAALLPVAGGGVAVAVTLGVLSVVARGTDISIFAMNTVTMLGLAIGIDYSLFMVGRFREEMQAGREVASAVEVTVERAGRAIFFSGLAVAAGLAGLAGFHTMALRSIGLGGLLVVCFSVLAALTLLPALLGVLGPRVDSLRLFGRGPRGDGRFWRRWSAWVMDHPAGVLVVSIGLMLVISWPALSIIVDVPGAATLPRSAESRRGYDLVQERFEPAATGPIHVVLTWDGDGAPFARANLERAFAVGQQLEALPGVEKVTSVVTLPGVDSPRAVDRFWRGLGVTSEGAPGRGAPAGAPSPAPSGTPSPTATSSAASPSPAATPVAGPGGLPLALFGGAYAQQTRAAALQLARTSTGPGTILFEVSPASSPSSGEARALVRRIGELAPPPGAQLHVGGVSQGINDYLDELTRSWPWVVAFVMIVTYLILLVLLRSLLLPLKAVVVNSLSLLAAYGALVVVFQWGHLEGLLRFESTGVVDADLPLLIFCGIFGISMDYEVFLLSRIRESWLETHDNRASVSAGLAATGRIITSAALIIVVVAFSFTFTSIIITKAMGFGMAVAVALDATVIRILMVPALMRVFGTVNWYLPAWLDRLLPRVGDE